MKYLLEAQSVNKEYRTGWRHSRTILADVNLAIRPGEVVSLIGNNGAGKTTLLKIMVGLTKPSSGQITINGQDVATPAARRWLGYMPENPQFYPDISPQALLLHLAGLFGYDQKTSRQEALRLLKLVDLSGVRRQPIRTFSKGMRQRLGFAQSLIGQPKILLLDEPLDGLDPLGRNTLKNHILELKKQGITIILCSHILSDIAEISDYIGIVHQQTVTPLQTPKQIIKRSPSLEEAFVKYVGARP